MLRLVGKERARLAVAGSFAVLLLTAAGASAGPPQADAKQAVAFFEKKVRPLLANHCFTCHSADTRPSGGLRLDDRNGLLSGGKSGPAIVPGKPGAVCCSAASPRRTPRAGCRARANPCRTKKLPL